MAWLPESYADKSDENNEYLVTNANMDMFQIAYWDQENKDWFAANTEDDYGAPARVNFNVCLQMWVGRMKSIIDEHEENYDE